MLKNKYFKVIIILILFSLIYLINIFNNLKYGKNLLDVIIKIDCNSDVFNQINAYKISLKDNIYKLLNDNDRNIFYYLDNGYYKKIKLEIPESCLNLLNYVEVKIGNKKFRYNLNELIEEWDYEKNNNVFYSPDSLTSSKSIIPFFKNIINWPGDYNFFVLTYVCYFISFIIFILIIYYLNYFLNKRIFNYHKFIGNECLINKIDKCLLSNEKNIIIYNFIYYFCIFIVIIFALFQRMYRNHLPLTDGDVWGYIGPAINFFDNGRFDHVSGRSFPYPFFILLVLNFFKDFSYISIIQHIIGILTAIFFLISWRNVLNLVDVNNNLKIKHDLMGIIVISLYLFSDKVIVFEHQLIRESIYPFFLILLVLFIIKYLVNIKNNSKSLYLWGTLFFINNYFLFVYQPRWGITLFFCFIIYILIVIFIKDKIIYKILFLLVIPFSLSFILIYLPEKILIKNETADKIFLAQHLFFGHAKIIDLEIEKDINDDNFNKFDKEVLENVRNAFHENFNAIQTKHKYLGYDFNRMVYSGWITGYLLEKMGNDEYKIFCNYYFKKAVLNHPIKYLKKVILELSQFYNFNGQMYLYRSQKNDRLLYTETYDKLNKSKQITYIPYIEYLDEVGKKTNSFYDLKEINVFLSDVMFFIFSKTYLIILIIFILIFLLNLIRYFKNKIQAEYLLFQLLIFLLFLFTFFISLTITSIYTYDVRRYFNDQTILSLFSQILALEYLFLYFFKIIKKNK